MPQDRHQEPQLQRLQLQAHQGAGDRRREDLPDVKDVLHPGGLRFMEQKQTLPKCPKCHSTMFESIPGKGVFRCPKANCDGKVMA